MPSLPFIDEIEKLETVNENIKLIRKRDGLTFGTDAYLLAAYVSRTPSALAIDLGSGTGILPLLHYCVLSVTAIFAKLGAPLTYLFVFVMLLVGSLCAIPHSVLHYRGDALAHSLE